MIYAGLFMTARKRRHLRARDPHNAIRLLAPPAQAPDDLWSKIEERLDHSAQPHTERNRQLFLGGLGGVAAAASLFAALHLSAPPSDRVMRAQLVHDGRAHQLIAAPDAGPRTMVSLTADNLAAPDGKSLEVWYVPAGGAPPGSLGLAPDAGAVSAHVLPGGDAAAGVLAISVEDSGGSPSGAPEGPIIATLPLKLLF